MSRRLRGKLSLHVEEFKKLDMVKKSNLPNMPGRPKHSIIVEFLPRYRADGLATTRKCKARIAISPTA